MRHRLSFLILVALPVLAGCHRQDTVITSLAMLKGGKTFAVPTGTVADQFVLKKVPDAKIKYFNSALDCAIALKTGKVDMIGAGLSITEERAKKVLFSESYYPSGIAVLVKAGSVIPQQGGEMLRTIDDIKDKRIGVFLGSIHDAYAAKYYPQATILEYQSVADMLIALTTEKIDVAFYDDAALPDVLHSNKSVAIMAKNVFFASVAAGFKKNNDTLRQQFNAFLQEIIVNGIYNDMISRWMERGLTDMPEIKSSGKNGPLKVGVVNDIGLPSAIYKNGRVVGFDIELGERFAAYTGRVYIPVNTQFSSMLAAVSAGKIDMITSFMMITEERAKQIDFSDPYYASGASVIALKKNIAGFREEGEGMKKVSFLRKLSNSFYDNIILERRYMLILNGLKVTVIITVLAALLGTILGGLVCLLRMSKSAFWSATAAAFITLIRGTPVLVLLMIIFYIIFASVNINPVLVAVIAFGINFGAYVSEMFRTSIESIDKGQREAGIAGGFTKVQTFIHIIMPQALRTVLPVYKGEFISLMKMTSIVGYIAVQDLTKAGDIIRSRTFDAFFPLIMAAVIYLALAWLLTWGLGKVEISVDPKRKRIRKAVEVRL